MPIDYRTPDNSGYKYKVKFKDVRIGQIFVEDGWRYVKLGVATEYEYHRGVNNARLIADVTEYATFAPDDIVLINNKPRKI